MTMASTEYLVDDKHVPPLHGQAKFPGIASNILVLCGLGQKLTVIMMSSPLSSIPVFYNKHET